MFPRRSSIDVPFAQSACPPVTDPAALPCFVAWGRALKEAGILESAVMLVQEVASAVIFLEFRNLQNQGVRKLVALYSVAPKPRPGDGAPYLYKAKTKGSRYYAISYSLSIPPSSPLSAEQCGGFVDVRRGGFQIDRVPEPRRVGVDKCTQVAHASANVLLHRLVGHVRLAAAVLVPGAAGPCGGRGNVAGHP
jgi:hypothetical protein